MALKKNLLANLLGQFWGTALTVLTVPYYVRLLGIESYALIGLHAVIQSWFTLLDLGMSPTLGREVARHRGGLVESADLLGLLNSLEKIFLAAGLAAVGAIALLSRRLAETWLQPGSLPLSTTSACLVLMGGIACLRWQAGLYRAGIIGLERQVWLSVASAILQSLRFAGVLPVLLVRPRIELFFVFQAGVAAAECVLLRWFLRAELGAARVRARPFSWSSLRPLAEFAASLGFTTAVWVLVTQSDKLILSRILSLADYGYFALAVLLAGGITILAAPLQQAVVPRMTVLLSQQGNRPAMDLYHLAAQGIAVLAVPVGLVLALRPESVVHAWTGDRQLATSVAPVLVWYALGNLCLTLAMPSYFLQCAKGNLRLHVLGNVIFVALLLPVMIWAALRHGAGGAGLAWFGVNLFFLLVWVPLVLSRVAPAETLRWLLQDVALPSAAAVAVIVPGGRYVVGPAGDSGRATALLGCVVLWAAGLLAASFSAPLIRERWRSSFRREGPRLGERT